MGRRRERIQVRAIVILCHVVPFDGEYCRPERWDDIPEAVKGLPSVYGHLVTFIAGAHACIGYRFSVTEYVYHIIISLAKACRGDRLRTSVIVSQDQSSLIYVGAHIRVRIGSAARGYYLQD